MDWTEKALKHVVFGALFVVPFIVFVVDSSQVFPFITGKNFLFRVLVGTSFFAWLGLIFFREEYRPKKSLLLLSVSILVAVMFLAGLFGIEPKQSFWSNFERMDGWITLVHLLAFMVVLSSTLHTKELWKKFWNTTVIASFGVGLFAMAQLLREYLTETLGLPGDQGLAGLLPIVNQGGDRLDATFGNATYLAVYMLFHVFITVTLLLRYKEYGKKLKWFYIVALILQLLSLYYTATRGAILGLIGGAIFTALILFVIEQRGTAVKRLSAGVLVSLIVLVGTFFAIKDTKFVENQNTLNRLSNISLEDKTTNSRFIMWGLSWEGFKERPILGYGQGNFNYVFNKHYNPELYDQEQWFDRAHNIVFDWLIAGGIVGFAAYVFIYVVLIRMIIKSNQLSKREKAVFMGMLSAYIFQNMFVFDQITSYMILFAFLAYMHTLESKGTLFKKVFSIEFGNIDRLILPVIIISIFAVPFFVNASGYFQSRTAIRAMNIPRANSVQELQDNIRKSKELFAKAIGYNSFGTAEIRERLPNMTVQIIRSEQVGEDIKQEFVQLTRKEMERQIEETPDDARYNIIYGGFLAQIGLFDEALPYIERSIELSTNKQIIYREAAQIHALNDNFAEMFALSKKGYEIYEENDDAWVMYAIAARVSGQEEVYQQLVDEALLQGKFQRVITSLQSQINSNPNIPGLRFSLALVYAQAGQNDQAISMIRELQEEFPEQFGSQGDDLIRQIEEQTGVRAAQ